MKMICPEQEEWFANQSLKRGENYHERGILFIAELAYLSTIMFVATFANISIAVAILRVPKLRRNLNNILILNLIVVDLNTTLGSMPFSFADLFKTGFLICYPVLCRIQCIFSLIGCFGNFAAIVLISIYRCMNIVIGNRVTITRRHIALMIAIGWACSTLISFPPVTGFTVTHAYHLGTHHCTPEWEKSCTYYSFCVSFMYLITIPTLVVCYTLIRIEVVKSESRVDKYMHDKQTETCQKGHTHATTHALPDADEQLFESKISNAEEIDGDSRGRDRAHIPQPITTISETISLHIEEISEHETSHQWGFVEPLRTRAPPRRRHRVDRHRVDRRVTLAGKFPTQKPN
ncbi:Medium-wave-sensitive opsin 1 [Holothuria leucospilota]|uniref:Medium-wave-sensitive opsin 1 n=1 Tax=Holothuria leucospilota TaxID=206669 RepID=A0A9Q1C9Y2_HOLLE|nr:Medium-wave-sensitive opsin 1 [Holothuria leucospilota]